MNAKNLTEGSIGKTLLAFAFPYMIANLLQALYGAADLFVVGQYAGAEAVSAVATGSQLMQAITSIILGISMGSTVLLGQNIGAGNKEGASQTIGTSIYIFCALAVILTPLTLLFTNNFLSLMQVPGEALVSAKLYLTICFCGIPFIIGYNVVSSIYRGLGDSKTPVYFIAIACVINIITDFVLVGGFRMGAAGAAIATVTSQAVSFLIALLHMRKKGLGFTFSKGSLRFYPALAGKIFRVGLPIALQDSLVTLSFLTITSIINAMGVVASASVGVVEKLIAFAMLPPSALGSATAAMTAQNIGAGKPKRARQSLYRAILFALIPGVLICTYAQFLPHTLTRIFTNDPDVIASAALYLRFYSLDCVLVSGIFTMNGYFSGCGKSIVSMLHSLAATFLIRIPVSWLLSRMEGVTLFELGFAPPAASIFSVIVCSCYFFYTLRKESSL